MRLRLLIAMTVLAMIAGCQSTDVTELPLGPNRVMLQVTTGSDWTDEVTLKAAESTLSRGYTHFLLDQANVQSGSQVITMKDRGGGRFTPVTADFTEISVTVNMFKAKEGTARGAFDAQQVVSASKKK
ncbi:hypothetical protein J2Z19_003729 [Ensifer adhaerens]|uniref:Uncharacterized protein n=1 Tax=Ensifer adhaerens TaxID=106592 RepID=A0ACC5SYX3_ENSAD|nr:hypothetical protein [Ensifer adhaerens]MBP1874010.1 hypothetical protein [Ensifer adhaerens]